MVREGGVAILSHPTPWAFHPVHHPSYIDFFEEVLSDTTDPIEIEKTYEERFATDEWYRHLYRTSHAYHGVHPFYMWYWGAHALEHLGRVIVVGGEPRAVRRLGFSPASTLTDALEMATDTVGRDPTITHLHCPPIMLADVALMAVGRIGRGPVGPISPGAVRPRRRLPVTPDRPGGPPGFAHLAGVGARSAFPVAAPDLAGIVCRGPRWTRTLGVDYDTEWARRYPTRLARVLVPELVARPVCAPWPHRG